MKNTTNFLKSLSLPQFTPSVVPTVITAEKVARLLPQGAQYILSSPVTYSNVVEPTISGQSVAAVDPFV